MKIGIVGCGINGAYLAWKLSKENEVEVFEKNSVIGEKPCSELVSERIWKFIPKKQELIRNLIEELVIHFPKNDVKLRFYPKMYVIDRKQLANYIVELAKQNGAKFNLNSEVKKVFYIKGKRPQISVLGKVLEFDYLIGCDGYNSVVRKSLGIKDPLCILGIYTRIAKKPKSNVIHVYPLRNGISWIIPRKNDVEYGVYEKLDTARKEFDNFCKRMKIKPKEIYSHMIPSRLTKMHKERIALCGDAIGITKPWSYGGIVWGLIADDILVNNFPNFSRYEELVRDYFEPKIFYSKIALFAGKFIGNKLPFLAPKEVWFDGDWVF
ncbi:MAG: FAD-dependent monooxygenase [Candidatus Aenigmatarchaeota archaeon]